MGLLNLISELNSNRINPTLDELMRHYCNSKPFLELMISDLVEKRFLEEIEITDYTGAYENTGYATTEKGKSAFNRYVSQVRYFVSRLDELYEKGDVDNLEKTLVDNRDEMLRFAYYNGLITRAKIEKFAKKLDMNLERIWWGDSEGRTSGRGWGN